MSEDNVPLEDIIAFTQDLVRTPSQAVEDDPQNIIKVIADWADDRKLSFHRLTNENGKDVGGYFHYSSGKPGQSICLNACIDTCQFGAEETWNHPPASAKIDGDFMYGRGVADSKVAVSVFCHIFDAVSKTGLNSGDLYVLLDADEHTGNFGGIKSFLKEDKKVDFVFIGYPGTKEIMVGARGFLRAEISVYGAAAHSGSRQPAKDNAILKAARLIDMISNTPLPEENDPLFPFGPKATVTAINGGQAFSQVPDKVDINLDMRLTPSFNRNIADAWLRNIIKEFDKINSPPSDAGISYKESWPSYLVPAAHPILVALHKNAEREMGHPVALSASGPSNIGNLLAQHNIPATCGFGVEGLNAHAPNESIRISSITPAYKAYHKTIKALCL